MKKAAITRGDRFIKVEDPRTVWVVERVVDVPDPIMHVQLFQEGRPQRRRTLAESVLRDRGFYQKIN